jgi:predicted XRE-type DNA-binding protein
MMKKLEYEEFANVWDAICDTPEESANLTLRSDLMGQIEELIQESGWTQAEAAKRCGVTQLWAAR